MKYFFVLMLLIKTIFSVNAQQNLVVNPSFEDYSICPDFFSQLNRATGWYSSRPTADFFQTCSPMYPHPYTCVNVPYTSFGYRTPSSGNGFAGIISKSWHSEHREHIGSQLISPLQIGTKYYISFQVSTGGDMYIGRWCGINKLGVLLSTIRYDSLSPSPICINCAQIQSDSIITDTLNWTRITGSFVADSNYSFIHIGRFNPDSLTDSILIAGADCYTYYFIDDICVSTDSNFVNNYSFNSIKEINQQCLLYPNPFFDQITLQTNFILNDVTLSIKNLLGQSVKEIKNISGTNYVLARDNLPTGVYFLHLIRDQISLTTYKIIISDR